MKRLHALQGSSSTRGSLSTCPGHPARWDSFYNVNGSCWAIPVNRGTINRESIAARGEFFSYELQFATVINVVDDSQAENRLVPVEKAKIR